MDPEQKVTRSSNMEQPKKKSGPQQELKEDKKKFKSQQLTPSHSQDQLTEHLNQIAFKRQRVFCESFLSDWYSTIYNGQMSVTLGKIQIGGALIMFAILLILVELGTIPELKGVGFAFAGTVSNKKPFGTILKLLS